MDPVSGVSGFALDVGKSIAEKGLFALAKKASGGFQHLGTQLWRRNGELRISISALVRIRRDDGSFALIRNRHRAENYSPVGGCYKFYTGMGHDQLKKFDFYEEDFASDKDLLLDLRGYSKRKHLPKIKSWLNHPESAKESPRECIIREMKEELSEEFKVVPPDFSWDSLQFSRHNTAQTFKTFDLGNRILTQFQRFEVYNIITNKAALDLLDVLNAYKGSSLLWVTSREITVGRTAYKNKHYPISAPAELLIKSRITRPPSMPLVADTRSRG